MDLSPRSILSRKHHADAAAVVRQLRWLVWCGEVEEGGNEAHNLGSFSGCFSGCASSPRSRGNLVSGKCESAQDTRPQGVRACSSSMSSVPVHFSMLSIFPRLPWRSPWPIHRSLFTRARRRESAPKLTDAHLCLGIRENAAAESWRAQIALRHATTRYLQRASPHGR